MGKRKAMGQIETVGNESVLFPVPENLKRMPVEYKSFIHSIIDDIQKQKIATFLRANHDMICLYWHIGHRILEKQSVEGWGAKIIDRMSYDLRNAFPEMSGFSARNLKYMRKFAETYDFEFVQRSVAQIPWRSNIVLMERLKDNASREWYAQKTIEHGWS